jgi:hypothetical protein
MPEPLNRSSFEDIIRFYNEGNSLDFKAIQYKKEQFPALLKDVISMANSFTIEDRYIIIGVKLNSDGSREINGVTDLVEDEATYQQLITENIEPDLSVEYVPFDIDEKRIMFFRISNYLDKPYMMKKDYHGLKKGEFFIRKGSHQTRLNRNDLDRIFAEKLEKVSLSGDNVAIVFEKSNETICKVAPILEFKLPSEQYKEEILELIRLKEKTNNILEGNIPPRKRYEPELSHISFDIKKLQSDLDRADKSYLSEDHNYKFEEVGAKINFVIYNTGTDYVKDASIEIAVPYIKGLEMATRIYSNTYNPLLASAFPQPREPSAGEYKSLYPAISYRDGHYILFQELGDIRHYIPCMAFKTPVSLFLPTPTMGESLVIKCKLFGQNLKCPVTKSLILEIINDN